MFCLLVFARKSKTPLPTTGERDKKHSSSWTRVALPSTRGQFPRLAPSQVFALRTRPHTPSALLRRRRIRYTSSPPLAVSTAFYHACGASITFLRAEGRLQRTSLKRGPRGCRPSAVPSHTHTPCTPAVRASATRSVTAACVLRRGGGGSLWDDAVAAHLGGSTKGGPHGATFRR